MTIDLSTLSSFDAQSYLQHLIAPRPICFASTINKNGDVNLSPFSFFNLFSTNPPIVIFSPSRRVRDNTTKHTLQNVIEVPEVAISIVDYNMVQQMSLASCDYPSGINEFEKSGFTMEASTLIKPPMVKESKANFECRVLEVKALGNEGGAGNLVICEILRLHVDESILDENKKVDQRKMQHVARLGANWYCKVDESNLFEVEKPNVKLGIGFNALPNHILNSKILTGNHLGILANIEILPVIDNDFSDATFDQLNHSTSDLHQYAATLIDKGFVAKAWQVLLRTNN